MFVVSETSPKPERPNCDLLYNATVEQLQKLIDIGCSIDISNTDEEKNLRLIPLD